MNDSPDATFVGAAYALAGTFFIAEPLLRRGDEAKSLASGDADRGTTREIGTSYGLALAAGGARTLLQFGRLPLRPWLRALGLAAMVAGLLIKLWAMLTLGRSYTRTLRVAADQRVVQAGPYRLVRHPGYLGALLTWFGFALALANWVVAAIVATRMLPAYLRRMRAEETMLISALGEEYAAYRRRSRRLIPWLY